MSAETTLYAALSGAAGVTALVSTRIYPDVLPEKVVYPAIVFSRTSTAPTYSISNTYYGADVGIQIGCWAATRVSADAIAAAVQAALVANGLTHQGRNAGYDPDTDLFVSITELEMFEAP